MVAVRGDLQSRIIDSVTKLDNCMIRLLSKRQEDENCEFDDACRVIRQLLQAESCAFFRVIAEPAKPAMLVLDGQDAAMHRRTVAEPVPIESRRGGGLTAHLAKQRKVVR